jgi:peptidoglycan/LPS O-acetylase OafA/YrhL
MTANHKTVYINGLTSLRGIAALVVLWSHARGYFFRPWPEWIDFCVTYTPLRLLLDTGMAINLFFVLSGFVLSINMFSREKNFRIDTYAIYRIIRICFPFWAILIFSYFAHEYLHVVYNIDPFSYADELWAKEITWKDFANEASFFKLNYPFYLVPQAWTLAIELKLSLLVPLLVYFAARSNFELLIFTLFCVIIFKLPHYVFNFCCGVFVAKYYSDIKVYISNCSIYKIIALIVAGSYISAIPGLLHINFFENIYLGVSTHAIGAMLILIAALGCEKILMLPVLQFIGKISYSLYLSHMLIFWIAAPRFIAILNQLHTHATVTKLLTFIFITTSALAFATVFYYFVEKPLLSLGKKILAFYEQFISNKQLKKGLAHHAF